jgi:hypothetical protein
MGTECQTRPRLSQVRKLRLKGRGVTAIDNLEMLSVRARPGGF